MNATNDNLNDGLCSKRLSGKRWRLRQWMLLAFASSCLAALPAQAQTQIQSEARGPSGATAQATAQPLPDGLAQAIFAGGCFWCMEAPFDQVEGVLSTTSGYTGGTVTNPTYEQVSAGGTGHTEGVRIVFDPQKTSFEKLLEVYWRNVDPTVNDRQFCDVGTQYRPEIFYMNPKQQEAAERSKSEQARTKPFKADIVVAITPATEFWPAEEYHQNYSAKNPVRYWFYRRSCGRDARLKELWGEQAGH